MLFGGAEKREEMSVQTTVQFHKFSFELSIDPLLIPSLTCVSLPSHTCRSCHYCIQNNFDSVANYSCKPNTLKKSLINCSQKQRRSVIVLVFSGAIQLFIQTKTTADAQRQFSSAADCLITIITMTHQREMERITVTFIFLA